MPNIEQDATLARFSKGRMRPATFNRTIRLAVREVCDDVTGPELRCHLPHRWGCVAHMDQERQVELSRHGLCILNRF